VPPPAVIVQPPPPAAPALPPARAARIWTATRRAGLALASVAALVISLLAAFSQRAAAVLDMFFRDRDDRSWLVDRTGLLTSVAADAAGYYDGTSVPSPFEALIKPIPGRLVTIRRAQTCS
jgi:hypothetical protein